MLVAVQGGLRSVLGDCEAAQGAGGVNHDLGWSIPLMWSTVVDAAARPLIWARFWADRSFGLEMVVRCQ